MWHRTLIVTSLLIIIAAGCTDSPAPQPDVASSTQPANVASPYLLSSEPTGVKPVIQARKQAKDADDVVVVGRIGGSENPWIEGLAAFSIVDPSLKACSDIPGDSCPTPWDYCCDSKDLAQSKALVKIVDDKGQLVEQDARKLLALKELQTVVVKGKAQRDDKGNLTILASGLYVRPDRFAAASPTDKPGAGHKHDADHHHDADHKHDGDHKHGADHKHDGDHKHGDAGHDHKHDADHKHKDDDHKHEGHEKKD